MLMLLRGFQGLRWFWAKGSGLRVSGLGEEGLGLCGWGLGGLCEVMAKGLCYDDGGRLLLYGLLVKCC